MPSPHRVWFVKVIEWHHFHENQTRLCGYTSFQLFSVTSVHRRISLSTINRQTGQLSFNAYRNGAQLMSALQLIPCRSHIWRPIICVSKTALDYGLDSFIESAWRTPRHSIHSMMFKQINETLDVQVHADVNGVAWQTHSLAEKPTRNSARTRLTKKPNCSPPKTSCERLQRKHLKAHALDFRRLL